MQRDGSAVYILKYGKRWLMSVFQTHFFLFHETNLTETAVLISARIGQF